MKTAFSGHAQAAVNIQLDVQTLARSICLENYDAETRRRSVDGRWYFPLPRFSIQNGPATMSSLPTPSRSNACNASPLGIGEITRLEPRLAWIVAISASIGSTAKRC